MVISLFFETRVCFLRQCPAMTNERESPKKANNMFWIAWHSQQRIWNLSWHHFIRLLQQFNYLNIQRSFPFPIHRTHFRPQELDLHPTHHILTLSLFLLTQPIPTQFLSLLTQYPFQITQYPSLPPPPLVIESWRVTGIFAHHSLRKVKSIRPVPSSCF